MVLKLAALHCCNLGHYMHIAIIALGACIALVIGCRHSMETHKIC